tara:strand:+ start:3914 stop:4375 length:462 start_codon:yes stop_codon:yes gene_type:complete
MKSYSHIVKGLDPVADAFAGTVSTDVVSLKNHETVEFYIYKGVGATGTSTITVEACDDTTPTTTSAVAFRYQTVVTDDTHSAMTEATVAGFATVAGSSQLYKVSVDASALAVSGYEYVRLKAVEVVDSPVLGGIMIALLTPRFDQAVQASVID